MIFGKIDYLNLLPFHVFMKSYMRHSRFKSTINHKKGVPSQINKAFKQRRVDAAFVSSVQANHYNCVGLGIIAKKEVLSVLVIPGRDQKDTASATSNALADMLGVKGQVLIGDKALAYQLDHDDGIDLAKLWNEKYHLPFVFATLCYHKQGPYLKKVSKAFSKREVKIPYYLLKQASQKTGISMRDIKYYLTKISYNMDTKSKHSLKKFIKLQQRSQYDSHQKYT
jgi:chorismate dehydratase